MINRFERVRSFASFIALALVLLLPVLSLVPLGSLWLWQHGYLLHWSAAAMLSVTIIYAIERWLLRRFVDTAATVPPPEPRDATSTNWTPAEADAWQTVQNIAANADIEQLQSRDAVWALGLETIEAVARRLHPEVREPVWKFTVLEALSLFERVSHRLGTFAANSIPLSDRLTVGQLITIYRWRGAIDVADRLYGIWRLVRIANPMAAATQEMRERLGRQMLAWGQAHVSERLVRAYVEEVGRAAIELYGGQHEHRFSPPR